MPVQRASAAKASEQLSVSASDAVEQIPVVEVKKRSRSKDAVKSSRKSKKSPEKGAKTRTKSKSPARSSSRSRREGTKARRTASPQAKPARGAKLYTKKDLVQDIAPEIPQKRVLRSSSSRSTSELKSIKSELQPTSEQEVESIAPKLNESNADEVQSSSCKFSCLKRVCDSFSKCPVFQSGYLQANKCILMRILMVSFLLMAVLAVFNLYDSNKELVNEQASIYLNSFTKCFENMKKSVLNLKSKVF